MGCGRRPTGALWCTLLCAGVVFAAAPAFPGETRVRVRGESILVNDEPTKLLGLRCSNALASDDATDDLIAALETYQAHGLNTVSVFLMGSRFGDVKGYRPDASLEPVYRDRFERILRATDARGMVTIVGCLYWSTSRAKEDLAGWTQEDADRAVANTARWLGDAGFEHVILDPDNEGMAVRANDWSAEALIGAAKRANPGLVVANNTRQSPPNEDLNMHFGEKERGKPWLDSEATPRNAPGGYWGRYSKETYQRDSDYYNYSRVGRYTEEMKREQRERTRDETRRYSGFVLASTWLQCGPAEGVGGPFSRPGGHSKLGSVEDADEAWNRDIDELHADAGIRWWLEFVRDELREEASEDSPADTSERDA